MSPSVALLKAQHYGEWLPVRARGEAAGNVGPYSVDHLRASGFELRWSDRVFGWPWTHPLPARVLARIVHECPEALGISNALANRALMRGADITLGIFEDQGSFAAYARARRLWGLAPRRIALLVCWMAEWAQHADARTLRAYRRVLAGADLVVCFSANQVEVFEGLLGVDPARLLVAPFGIDVDFFAQAEERDDGYVLAIGQDRSRDHELLVQALRDTAIATRIYAPKLDVASVPENVMWITERIEHVAYRELLAGASAVVVPTKATRYPGGQTVVLEAMAASKPVITTDSPAIRDYVSDGVNGLLVAQGDAAGLRAAIERVYSDAQLRARLVDGGLRAVRERFNQRAMWAAIAPRLHALLEEPRG
jgi:glycosyltransferase involved in cell wall biosynthesis